MMHCLEAKKLLHPKLKDHDINVINEDISVDTLPHPHPIFLSMEMGVQNVLCKMHVQGGPESSFK